MGYRCLTTPSPLSLFSLFLSLMESVLLSSGHGGSRTAEYLKKNLFNNLSSHPDFIKDTKTAIGMKSADFFFFCFAYWIQFLYRTFFLVDHEAEMCFFTAVEVFRQTDVDYLNEEKCQQREAGSTASTALLLGDRLFVANVGDSRVVGSRAGSGCCLLC